MNLRPNPDEIEVSLFGPGYGECVVIHIGNDKWIIIDSCIEPISKLPAALKYLNDISVNPAASVETIIATHWHDDHVRGLSETLQGCQNAEFVCSGALQCKEFLLLTNAYSARSSLSRGLKEFGNVLEILNERKQPPKFAIADRCLLRSPIEIDCHNPELELYSLTPSDESIKLAQLEIANLIPGKKQLKNDLILQGPNHASVVTWFKIAGIHILLGADLYNTSSAYSGWNGVLNSSARPSGSASVYKISHHGSKKSDNPDVWKKLLTDNPLAILTPFSNGNVILPMDSDVNRICQFTDKGYITANAKPVKIKREKVVDELIKGATRSITTINKSFGQVQIRTKIDEYENWRVKLSGSATSLSTLNKN